MGTSHAQWEFGVHYTCQIIMQETSWEKNVAYQMNQPPHDSQISPTTEPSDVNLKQVNHAIYAVYIIHLLFVFLLG